MAFECPGPVSHFSLSSPRSRQIRSPLSPHLQSRLSYSRQHRPGLASPAGPGRRAPWLSAESQQEKTFGLLCLANIQVTWYTFDKAIGQNCCSLERRLFMKNSKNTTLYIPETLDLKLESSWELLATWVLHFLWYSSISIQKLPIQVKKLTKLVDLTVWGAEVGSSFVTFCQFTIQNLLTKN